MSRRVATEVNVTLMSVLDSKSDSASESVKPQETPGCSKSEAVSSGAVAFVKFSLRAAGFKTVYIVKYFAVNFSCCALCTCSVYTE